MHGGRRLDSGSGDAELGRNIGDGRRRSGRGRLVHRDVGGGCQRFRHGRGHLVGQVTLQKTRVPRGPLRRYRWLVVRHAVRLLTDSFEPQPAVVLRVHAARRSHRFGITQPRRGVRHRTVVLAELVPKVLHAHLGR